MLKLFQNLGDILRKGTDCMLVSLVESTGSSPRSAGAYMLVTAAGRVYGTIGGGNLEYQATFEAQRLLRAGEGRLVDYDLSCDTAEGLGMICGGRAKVLFSHFHGGCEKDIAFANRGLELVRKRKMYHILLPLEPGEAQIREKLDAPKRQFGYVEQGVSYYTEQFNDDGKVYILGGGHLSQELVPLMSHVGFNCIVADDREEFARPERFPGAEAVKHVDFGRLDLPIGGADYIIIATRGHLADADCIRYALKTDAKFIGAVGSRKKVRYIRETMLSEGFPEKKIDTIVSPIGLNIGSETPAEIAVSIVAQLIQVRANWNQ